MINFRFHIVSLTAVLLALGIGLVLGTTFLDDALEQTLKKQLNDLEASLASARQRNDELTRQLKAYQEESATLDEQLGERLYPGQLSNDPVLVVATKGVDKKWVDETMLVLGQANAQVLGTWWLTDRLNLDDDQKVSDLAKALELTTDDADRLRRSFAEQMGDVLFGPTDTDIAAGAVAPGRAEPPLVARLRTAGFLDYQMPDGADGDIVQLPTAGLRVVVVDGPGAQVAPDQIVEPLLSRLAEDGPVPVVAVQPLPVPEDEPAKDEEPPATPLVEQIRDDGKLKDRLSTVDDLDRVAGHAALVLAAADARPGTPEIGHYGATDGADRLLPPASGEK
jgi:Copper transport outer membrane protein, MctB